MLVQFFFWGSFFLILGFCERFVIFQAQSVWAHVPPIEGPIQVKPSTFYKPEVSGSKERQPTLLLAEKKVRFIRFESFKVSNLIK